MAINLKRAILAALFIGNAADAATVNGATYTNFGLDLIKPIFPVTGQLAVYKNKGDTNARITLRNKPVVELEGDWRSCLKTVPDGWVRCTVDGESGWVKRADFQAGGEYSPITNWPFRWWLYVASDGAGGEENDGIRAAARSNPYLVSPSAFNNIFFHVLFDKEGRAISPRNGKPTGDRVFVVNRAVYLAPDNQAKRNAANWLFLGFFHEDLPALCPALQQNSCMSAVNTAPGWAGIKALYEEPLPAFRRKDDTPWFGASLVAFARHNDPVVPLMYHVPENVPMKIDTNPISDLQLKKNRQKPFCIADCVRDLKPAP